MPDSVEFKTKLLERIERITNAGHWRYNIHEEQLLWSKEVYRIHGLNFDEYTPQVDAAIDAYLPEDRESVEECLREAIENKESFEFQKRIMRPDGDIRHVISQGECELDELGNVVSVFGTLQDITHIKKQQELYELSALGSGAAPWDWDIRKDELKWAGHAAKILNIPEKELPQSTRDFFEKHVHPEDRELIKSAFSEHFKNNEAFSIEIRISKNLRDYRWFLAKAQAQWDRDGKAKRVCGSLNDITNLKETQEKLKRSNEDLEQFATTAAHDLKAPLRAISGFLEIVKERNHDKLDKETLQHINYAIGGAEEMGELVSDLLEYARLETEGLKKESVNIDKIVKLVIRGLKASVQETKAVFEFDKLPTIACDELKMKQLFKNLVENALKYKSDAAPNIKIKCTETPQEWLFSIADNGIGIQKKHLESVFLMFNRLHNKQDYPGTGIGLAICKKIVTLHEGSIWAESEIGKGTTFYFTIPRQSQTHKERN